MAQKYMYKTYFLRFDEILNLLECGHKLKRLHWEEGRYISLNSERNIIYLTEPDSIYEVSYLPSNNDIMAYDWEIVM